MSKLTPKQALFVQEYLVDLNATQAAIRAGYSGKRAAEIGYQLLQKTTVSESIQRAQNARAMRLGRTARDVLQDIIAVTREARESGDLKCALKGLEMEGKHLGMFAGNTREGDAPAADPLAAVQALREEYSQGGEPLQ